MSGDLSLKVVLPGGGSLGKKCYYVEGGVLRQKVFMPGDISQKGLMPGAPLPVDRRKDRHSKNITIATCVIRMHEVKMQLVQNYAAKIICKKKK